MRKAGRQVAYAGDLGSTPTHMMFSIRNLQQVRTQPGVFELRLMMKLAAGVCETGAPALYERDKPSLGKNTWAKKGTKHRREATQRSNLQDCLLLGVIPNSPNTSALVAGLTYQPKVLVFDELEMTLNNQLNHKLKLKEM